MNEADLKFHTNELEIMDLGVQVDSNGCNKQMGDVINNNHNTLHFGSRKRSQKNIASN